MKTTFFILPVLLLITAPKAASQKNINAEIAYIGNEGFMISNNGKKLFIDALYEDADQTIKNVDASLEQMIINNQYPFSNSQLFLVTHGHPDHFNNTYVSNYLKYNPQSRLIAPTGTAQSSEQLIEVHPDQYEKVDTTVNDIPLTIYNLLHINYARMYNVGYFADLDGFRIFHCADNVMEDTMEYVSFKLYEKEIDVAFFTSYAFWNNPTQREFVLRHINPKYIILMHIFNNEIESTKQAVNIVNASKTFPPILVFSESMEKVRVNDTIEFINRKPEKVAGMKDTIILVNTPVSITIPFLFQDPDINDSLSYSVSGLPDGLTFDSYIMNISGTTAKAGNYTVRITVKDTSLCAASTSFKMTIGDPMESPDMNQMRMEVYPNPAKDQILISNVNSSGAFIQFYDLQGKMLRSEQIAGNRVDVSELSTGMYIVKLVDAEMVVIRKLIKD